MKESDTYQAILEEGRAEGELREVKKLLLHVRKKRFGRPGARVIAAIEAIGDLGRLEQLSERLLVVASWRELLADR